MSFFNKPVNDSPNDATSTGFTVSTDNGLIVTGAVVAGGTVLGSAMIGTMVMPVPTAVGLAAGAGLAYAGHRQNQDCLLYTSPSPRDS